jgi:pyridoxal phosphate enzyme (YggS family)
VDVIRAAVGLGLHRFGENKVQEIRDKAPPLADCGIDWVMIGHLQTNKAKAIAQVFDVVQSIDRPEAAAALAKAAAGLDKRLDVLVQLNISPSERHGVAPEHAERLAEAIRSHDSLRLDGVMAIGPIPGDRAEISRAFALAAKTFDRIGGSTFSIGMSGDWREAVRAGSTMLRIGTALFGPRTA